MFRRLGKGLLASGVFILFSCATRGETAEAPAFDAAAIEFFEAKVRPILVTRCYECHSAKAKAPKGGLRLDSRAHILRGGESGPAVSLDEGEVSRFIEAINYGDLFQMPPKSKLPAEEIAALTKWVKLGLPWPDEGAPGEEAAMEKFDLQKRLAEHWCWQPIREEDTPNVLNPDWPLVSIDRFILAKLEMQELVPAVAAERRTLIRRASFDLTGLPPTSKEITEFVHDTEPQAFSRVVDRLLASPRFGERWARHWMDLVRYGESYGHEFDYTIPHAHHYRDYLIRAFNEDVRYDDFVVEHLAGDLVEPARLHPLHKSNESVIATGFWWLGEATHAPVDVVGDEANRVDNQIDVMTKTFLGLTVACARCHDHKFDAISTKDYYALSGFLKSSRRQEAFLDPDGEILATTEKMEVVKEQADKTLRAEMFKLSRGIQAGWPVFLAAARDAIWPELSDESPENNGSLTERVALIAATRGLDAEALGAWVAALTDEDVAKPSHPMHGWWELSNATDGNMSERFQQFGKRQQQLAARSLENQEKVPLMTDFSGDDFGDWFVTGDAFGKSPTQSGQWDGQLRRTNLAPAGVLHSGQLAKSHQGVLRSPSFILKHPQILYRLATQQANDASVLGENVQIRVICDSFFMDVHNGLLFEGFAFSPNTKGQWTWHRQAGDIGRYLGHRVHIEILDYGDGWLAVDEIRFSDGEFPAEVMSPVVEKLVMGEPIQSRKDLDLAVAGLFRESLKNWSQGAASPAQTDWVRWAVSKKLVEMPAVVHESLEMASQQLDDLAESLPSPTRVLAMADGNGQNRALYVRGNHKTLGEKVPRRLLTALSGAQDGIAAQGSGRLQLARQFVDPQNPLLSRVFVNRVWHHLFGRGIVASVDNFGVLGERPSHPQLLDYLATRFVTEGKTRSGEEGFGWSVKSLIREMVLSQTYRMSSRPDASASQVDPANQWLHRQRVRRLQGEVIRDAILAGSGRLDVKMFGSSVPVHVTPFMQGRGHPGSGPLDGEGRRSIFLSVRRNFLSPMMLAFDTPQPFNTQGRRTVSNVPAQALILLNDPFVIDQGKVWARRLLKERETSTRDRIRSLYVQAFGRPPTEEERTSAHEFVQVQSGEYGIELAAAWRDERIWADLCHVVMNTKEFIYLH